MELPPEKYTLHTGRYSPPGEPRYGFNNLWVAFAVAHQGYENRPPVPGTPRRELVPEPHNPVDPTAVAVYDRGRRIGYIPAEPAAAIHDPIRAINRRGKAVVVKPSTGAQGARVPYFRYTTEFYTDSGLPEELRQFVDDVVAQETDILLRPGYRITDDDLKTLRLHRDKVPSLTWPEIHPYYKQTWHLYGMVYSDRYIPGALRWEIKLKRDELEDYRHEIRENARIERDNKILRHYETRAELKDVAAEAGLSVSTVVTLLKRSGVSNIRTAHAVSRQQRDHEIARLYRSGSTQTSIARKLDIGQATVAKVLAASGIETDTVSNLQATLQRAEKAMEMARLQHEGASRAEIADSYGTSVGSVKLLLRDGRFYLDPEAYPERLEETHAIGEGAPAPDDRTKRLRRDKQVLTALERHDGRTIPASNADHHLPHAPERQAASRLVDTVANYGDARGEVERVADQSPPSLVRESSTPRGQDRPPRNSDDSDRESGDIKEPIPVRTSSSPESSSALARSSSSWWRRLFRTAS